MPKTTVAVLDIGSSKITVMVALKGVDTSFKVLGVGEAEYSGFYDGKFIDESELKYAIGLAISNAAKNSGCEIKKLYVGIPAEFCFCSVENVSIDFPKRKKITDTDVYDLYEKANSLKTDRDVMLLKASTIEYKLDHEIVCNDIRQAKAYTISANISLIYVYSDIINNLNKCFEELDVELVEYKSSAYVESKYLIENENDVLVDCGYLTTSVTAVRNKSLVMLSSFSLGGGYITADLFEGFKLKYSNAESLKRNLVLDFKPKMTDTYEIENVKHSAQDVNAIANYRLGQLAKTINKALEKNKIENVNKILLTGGGISYLKGVSTCLSNLLQKPVDIVAPPVVLLNKPHMSSILGLLDDVLSIEEKNKSSFLAKLMKR